MKILLIGVGYVGMALLSSLPKDSHIITTTTTTKEKIPLLQTLSNKVILLGEEEKEFCKAANEADAIIVLVAPSNNRNYEETYLSTAKKIIRAIKDNADPYIVYSSSTSVYEGLSGEVTEDLPLNSSLLLETENILLGHAKCCVLRLGGIYGPGRELYQRARKLSGKQLPGTGEEPTNHIHQEDIVRAIQFCLDKQLTGVYNLVNDDHRSRREIYDSLCHDLHLPPPTWTNSNKGSYIVSNKKIISNEFHILHNYCDPLKN